MKKPSSTKKPLSEKKYTSSTRPISAFVLAWASFESRIRIKAEAKTNAERRFINSKSFEATLRANVRTNRSNVNMRRIDAISQSLGVSAERQKIVQKLLGERTNSKGRVINSLQSKSSTEKLARYAKQIQKGTFNVERIIKSTKQYQSVKSNLDNPTLNDLITSLDRTNFYYENRELISKHNNNVKTKGVLKAKTLKVGEKLSDLHKDSKQSDIEDFTKLI